VWLLDACRVHETVAVQHCLKSRKYEPESFYGDLVYDTFFVNNYIIRLMLLLMMMMLMMLMMLMLLLMVLMGMMMMMMMMALTLVLGLVLMILHDMSV